MENKELSPQRSRRDFIKYAGIGALLAGCGTLTITDRVEDMSYTKYAAPILQQADELSNSKNPKDWRTAAEYYGSVGRIEGALDKMDACANKYMQEEPRMGLILLKSCQYRREFYTGKKPVSLEAAARQ